MSAPLQTASIAAPGFYGLNTQESSVTLASGFAMQADNCVIDKYGRLGARKGWSYVTTGTTGVNLKGAHEFIDIDGTRYFGCWSDTDFYIVENGGLTQVTYSGSNTITTDGWQAATLNDAAYLFSSNYDPIYFSPTTGVLDDIKNVTLQHAVTITSSGTTATVTHTAHGFATGQEVTISGATETEYNGTFTITVTGTNTYTYTLPNSTSSPATGSPVVTWQKTDPPKGNTVLSAYGRLWTANTTTNKTTVYWSDLLDGTNWDSGTSGSVDLSAVLVKGNDEIVALGAHSGRLIIFCKDNIVIYGSNSSTLDPASMQLVEVINNVGCIARDSVQNTGTDIVFLSRTGVQSLGRLIQEKSQPFRDLSKNVRDDLVRDVIGTDPDTIRSVYAASEAFYLLLIPEYKRIWCFDMRTQLQDGSTRVTVWDNQTQTNMIEVYDPTTKKFDMYFMQEDGVGEYGGYDDNGSSYTLKYYTNYMDFGDSTRLKFFKRFAATLIGGSEQPINFKVGFDYDDSYTTYPLVVASQANSEWGVAEYGIAEFTVGTLSDTIRVPVGGGGNVLQVGIEAVINGAPLSIQKMDLYIKQGRIY
jgi:hypothetical protein